MKPVAAYCFLLLLAVGLPTQAFEMYVSDTIPTTKGDLEITFIGHGTLQFSFQGKIIHVDPVSREGDYDMLPKADLVLVTHEHGDHLDPSVLPKICKQDTPVLMPTICKAKYPKGTWIRNGQSLSAAGFLVEAVPAYNLVHKNETGQAFHAKGVGNGYIISFGDKRVYVAGDTENTPEMKALKNIDIAFLPMNLPYTMTPAMVADAAKAFRPKILYPYHTGKTDTAELAQLLKDEKDIEVRIRPMQ